MNQEENFKFWNSKWKENWAPFHLSAVNPRLIEYASCLQLSPTMTVLVPLCGKTLDLIWLAQRCKKVVGIELSEIAIQSFFEENKLLAEKSIIDNTQCFRSNNIEIWNCDLFKSPSKTIGKFDLIYDRGCYIALPPHLRKLFYLKMKEYIHSTSEYFLITVLFDPHDPTTGPPFSVTEKEIKERFGALFNSITRLNTPKFEALEDVNRKRKRSVWHMTSSQPR